MQTICASSTAPGGAIGIIRVSGDKAIEITSRIFKGKTPLDQAKGYTLHYGEIPGVDDVLVIVYRTPHSYTGEDSTEIMCHGSNYIMQRILELLMNEGCVMARPGEYTQRAFLNGKMDLSQAEAVADLIASGNAATHRLAMSQMRGGFSSELRKLRDKLLEMTSLLELELDFSEEDVEFADRQTLLALAENIDATISRLVDSFRTGNAIKNGVPVAIIGETNVGKSTLLNCLLHEDKAIVSDIHGTTRDSIEDTISIQGIMFRFIDTAGIRETNDRIEQMGIERSWAKADNAEIVLLVTDTGEFNVGHSCLEGNERLEGSSHLEVSSHLEGKKVIRVYNKADLNGQTTGRLGEDSVAISAKQGLGIDSLEQMLVQAASVTNVSDSDIVVTNVRHVEALRHALSAIRKVEHQLNDNMSGDIISMDLHECIDALAEIVGDVTSEDTLRSIFSHFCIGK